MISLKFFEGIKSKNSLKILLLLYIIVLYSTLWGESKYALLIGISDYTTSGLPSLEGPRNDLYMIKNILLNRFHFKEENILFAFNQNATHTALEKAFSLLSKKIKKGDWVYIHYCGHGSLVPDSNGDEYPGAYDQTWVSYGARSTKVEGKDRYDITDDEINMWLIPIFEKTGNVIFISDSCHSGSSSRGDILAVRSVSPEHDYPESTSKVVFNKEYNTGILIGASQDNEMAFEADFDGKTHGLFSWYWAKALSHAIPGETWSDIFQRASIMVSTYFDQQHPQFQGDQDKGIFGNDIQQSPPRIPISKVWNKGKNIRIEAGYISGIFQGSLFRLYHPGIINKKERPQLVITRVTPFYSEAVLKKGGPKFKVGDLVTEEENTVYSFEWAAIFFKIGDSLLPFSRELYILMHYWKKRNNINRLKNLDSALKINVHLSITSWLPSAGPGFQRKSLLENKKWYKKQSEFNSSESLHNRDFQPGTILSFKIKNHSCKDCYVYILDIPENGKTEAVFPNPGDRWQKALIPAESEVDLKNSVLLLLEKPGKEIIKLIVTEVPINIGLLEKNASSIVGRSSGKNWGTQEYTLTIGKN